MAGYLSYTLCFRIFNLVNVAFQVLLGITTQFTLALNFLTEFQDFGSYGIMTT